MSDNSNKSSQCDSVASESQNSSPTSSRASFAPTLANGETAFEEFAWSVQQLCKKFWPKAYEEVTITRLDGGSFNRIVGLSVKLSLALTRKSAGMLPDIQNCEDRSEHYILRIARDDDSDIADHIMTLFYVQKHTCLPVPRILAFDIGSDNILESPYTLQQRMPGVPLSTVIKKMTFDQRRSLAVQIAEIIKQIQDVESPVAGKIGILTRVQQVTSENPGHEPQSPKLVELPLEKKLAFMTMTGLPCDTSEAPKAFEEAETNTDSMNTLQVLHFDLKPMFDPADPYTGVANTVTSEVLPVLSFLNFQFVRHMLQVLQNSPGDVVETRFLHKLMQIAHEMNDLHCLGKGVFNLFHGDLEPRNILVHVCDFGEVHIAGILDWDNAAFVPRAASCVAPRWIWSLSEDLDSSERDNEDDPIDPEQKALKETFDRAMGDAYVEMAYSPKYRLMRRLFRFSLNGFMPSQSFEEFESLNKEWAELQPELNKELEIVREWIAAEEKVKDDESGDNASEGDSSEDDASTAS